MKFLIIIFLLLSYLSHEAIPDKDEYVKYSINYNLKNGVYLSHYDFLSNSPIPFESIVSPEYDSDIIDKIKSVKKISFLDEFGNVAQIRTDDIWGYTRNGRPHINWAGSYHLIPYVGRVSHFVATIRVVYDHYSSGFHDPYRYPTSQRVRYQDEIRQFLIDFDTGEILDFTVENVEHILLRDEELAEEFDNLRRRQKQNMKFYYLRQYNERNPLFMPIN